MAKTLSHAEIKDDSIKVLLNILWQVGEQPLRPLADPQLRISIQEMNDTLENTTDETIMTIAETKNKRVISLMKVYMHLNHLFFNVDPTLIASASLRILELALTHGYSSASPMAFVYYAERQVALGNFDLAIRLGEFFYFN